MEAGWFLLQLYCCLYILCMQCIAACHVGEPGLLYSSQRKISNWDVFSYCFFLLFLNWFFSVSILVTVITYFYFSVTVTVNWINTAGVLPTEMFIFVIFDVHVQLMRRRCSLCYNCIYAWCKKSVSKWTCFIELKAEVTDLQTCRQMLRMAWCINVYYVRSFVAWLKYDS